MRCETGGGGARAAAQAGGPAAAIYPRVVLRGRVMWLIGVRVAACRRRKISVGAERNRFFPLSPSLHISLLVDSPGHGSLPSLRLGYEARQLRGTVAAGLRAGQLPRLGAPRSGLVGEGMQAARRRAAASGDAG